MDKERQNRNLFAQWQRSGTYQARTLVLPGQCVKNTLWNVNSNEPQGKLRLCRNANGWHIQVSYFPPNIFSDRATIAWTVEKRLTKLTLPKYIRKQEDSHQDHIGKQSTVYFSIEFPSGMRLKIRYLHREEQKVKRKLTSDLNSWHWLHKNSKQGHKPEATRWCNSQRITKSSFWRHPNRQHMPELWKLDITNESDSEPKNSQFSR